MSQSNFWGPLIRELRTQQKISQRQLSEATRVNRATLRKIEAGTTPGDIDSMERLLHYLGYELDAVSKESVEEKDRRFQEIENDPDKRADLAASRLLTMHLI